jgi:tetratricopeptide (TPR) repeat protein
MPADPAAVKALFLEAVAIDDPRARAAFVNDRCGADAALHARVNALLDANDWAVANKQTASFGAADAPAAASTADYPGPNEQAGTVIADKYTLLERIGEGGMGSVWRAKQTEPVKRFVAVKVIKAGMDSKQVLTRFEAERQALALMDHPNIAKVLDGGLHQHRPFFVMELVKGVPITHYCDQCKLTPKERLELFVPVCAAIQHAHQKGIIHRDIKPSNVLMALYDDRPVVKVIDFGVAKATGPALLVALVAGVFGTTLGLVQARWAAEAERLAKDDAVQQKQLAEKAAAQERQAKLNEAQRADGERKAKEEAQTKRLEAERNLAFAKKGNEILGSVFAGLDPKQIAESGRPLQDVLRQNLKTAVKELEGSALGDPLEVARMQNTLGLSLLALGEAPLAVEVHQKALDTCKAKLGLDHPHTLTSMHNLAVACHASGQLAKAVPLLEETLEKSKAKLGPNHSLTLATMASLAAAYQASGQLAKAVPLFEETLEKRKEKLGPDHPLTLTSLGSLAAAYQASGQLARAVVLHQETLQKMKAKLGPDHPDTLNTMNHLAAAYQASGQLAKAVPLLEKTLEKRKEKRGPDHPLTLISMSDLALAYKVNGQLAKAVPLVEETLEKTKAKLGPDHPHTLRCMNNLASAYQDNGQFAKAVPLFEEMLEKQKAKLGPEHPDTLQGVGNLGKAYAEAKQGEKAATTLVAFIDGSRKRAPKDDPQFAGLLALVSLDLIICEQHVAAEPLLRECLTIRQKTQPDAWTTFNTLSMLGGALLGQKKYADAEPLLLKGYEGMKQREKTIPPQGKVRLAEAAQRLVQLHEATGKKEEAVQWRTELERYTGKLVGPVHEVGPVLDLMGQLDAQNPALVYQMKFAAGKTYVIDMVSPDQKALDPYLFLLDAAGKTLAEDDNSGGGLNARIVFRAEKDGSYRIRATTLNAGSGAFTLTVREQPMQPRKEKD